MKISKLLFIVFFLLQYISFAQEPLISIYPEEGFILELDPNNPQATLSFTIYNDGLLPVTLDFSVESADSTYIIYVDEPDTNTFNGNIWRMRPDGTEKTQLTFDLLDRDAVWSPNGDKIAFYSYRSGNADVWIMDSDGSNSVNLTNHPAYDRNPHFSPDGQQIIFASGRDDPNGEIYRMNVNGSDVERLTFNSIQDSRPKYSPDGQYFATQSRIFPEENNIYVYTSDGQNYVNLGVANVLDDFQPSWSPDGKRVVWVCGDQMSGTLDIVSAKKDSGDFRVDFSTSENDYIPGYSPDGQFLAFSKSTFYSTGGDEIFVWHKSLDTLVQITDNTPISREWAPDWSPFINSPSWPSLNQDTTHIASGDSVVIEINIDASSVSFARHTASVMINNTTDNIFLAAVPVNLFYFQASGLGEPSDPVRFYELSQNFPNPFNPNTTVRYGITEKTFVELKVYDILCREVLTLVNEEQHAGYYEIKFDALNLSSGVYFYQLKAGSFVQTKKMVLLR